MPTELSDRCPKCGNSIPYTEEATEILCPFCGHSFPVVEFISERKKMEQALADSAQAQEKLRTAEAEKAALQARLNGTLSALTAIEDSQDESDKKLADILSDMKADRQAHEAMTDLLRAVQQDQQSGQNALSQLLRGLMKEQNGAADKLAVVQVIAQRILNAQQSGAKAVEQMQDEVLERIEALDMKARERVRLFNDFCTWSESMQKADIQRLERLQSSSDTLLQGQKAMNAKLDSLSDSIEQTKNAVHEGFDELRRQRLDTLIELYHQATGLQIERKFDQAEEKYRELLATGGPDAQDAEIYWRLLLCHYGVEYQEEKGKTIPIILRPDLTDPSAMQVRKDLREHFKNEQQEAYYAERLSKIDYYLQRYREVRLDPAWEFDVFISVKQNDHGHHTKDSDAASELYNYFIQDQALAAKHLRVFNSRYTHLPVGEEFEPYIITALMSAKVLIVVGSSPEYMNSQWVKNEWSRFQYLQQRERRQGKTDRRLFCYLTGGMQPRQLPAALNPDKQVLTEGLTTSNILREIMDKVFPDKMPPTPIPAPTPSAETPETIAKRMKAWLKLGLYPKVMTQYETLLNTRPEILTAEPWICLYTLCAKAEFRSIDLLAAARADLRSDPLYTLAYEEADAALRAKLDALWAKEPEPIPEEPVEEPSDKPQELTFPDGNYVGQVVNGMRHGQGVFTWKNGARYDGEWQNDKCNGKGVYTWADGDKYDGEWVDDKFSGQGIMTWKDGSRYEGEWKKGVFSGKGVMYYSDEDKFNRVKYDGQWRRGVRTGKGVMTWKDGSKYDGQWKNGKFNGKGVYDKANGERCEGEWAEDELVKAMPLRAAPEKAVSPRGEAPAVASDTPKVRTNEQSQAAAKRDPRLMGITTISAGGSHTVGLKEDGTVVAAGNNLLGLWGFSDWKNIVAVSVGHSYAVGLKEDGTVVAVGLNSFGQCDVSDWKNIVAVSAGFTHTVGLKEDSTVVVVGNNDFGQCDTTDWKNIVAISSGDNHIVGLKDDGTVVAVGMDIFGQCAVSGWTNIVAVSAGEYHTVGLNEDGTVVAVGNNEDGQCNVSDWTNIVAVSAGYYHTVGLKEDGTVVAVGKNEDGECAVSGWENIVAVSAGRYYTVGLKEDGTVVAVGSNQCGKCNVADWTDIRVPLWAKDVKTTSEEPDAPPQELTCPEGKYFGQVVNGQRHGTGLLYFNDNDKYKRSFYGGQFKDNKYHGRGVMTWKNDDKYDGEWKDGVRCGKGVGYYINGNRYKGEWKDDMYNGRGVLYYSDKDNRVKYDGEWKNGEHNGKGVMTWKDGDKYDGEWKDGKSNGHGVYYYANGDRYEGEWLNGDRVGEGTLIKSSGKRIPYKNGRRKLFF